MEKVPPKNVRLAIAVISARPDRRKAIRDTWLNWSDDRVKVLFFTEPPGQDADDEAAALTEEVRTYGDVIVQNVERGMNFGLKILTSMRWISDHYNFDYYLRLDDDYFLCLGRLLDELDCLHAEDNSTLVPFYAGFRACNKKRRISYVDESYILMSRVIVQRIVSSTKLQCSGYGSLTVGAWVNPGGPGNPDGDVEHVLDYRVDRWGHWWHGNKKHDVNVCEQNLGIHRTYPENMYVLWNSSELSNGSRTDPTSCEAFHYVDDGNCDFVQRGVPSEEIERDNGQPCSSFRVQAAQKYCGGQGCK
ncbi:unnamed protein product [Ectocarpus sp. 12 AP-2014]